MDGFEDFQRFDTMDHENINLLDIVPNAKQSQKNIYTFQDFKEWINQVDLNKAVVQPLQSKIRKPQSFQFPDSNIRVSNQSQKIRQTLGGGDQNIGNYLVSGPILQMGLKNRKMSIQANNPFEFDDTQRQNSIRQSSARSSRSFNGYQQINQYQLKEKIGKGAFSEVYLGIDVESEQKKKYAIKIMQSGRLKKKFFRKNSHQQRDSSQNTPNALNPQQTSFLNSSFRQDEKSSQFVNNQIAILKKIDHRYITKLYQVILDRQKGKAYLVLQYCENGFINQNRKKKQGNKALYKKLLESECKRYFKQLSLAINYIHTVVKIAHRDIKPQNILLSQNDQVKLSDFGLGTDKLESDQYSGTRLFMPPQSSMAAGKKNLKTQAADIWALGVTLLIMLTGITPEYKQNSIIRLKETIQQLKDVSPQLKNFLFCCLEKNPEKRMTSEQMLGHKWICGQDPFSLIIQRNLIKEFQVVVSPEQQKQAIKDVQIKKPKANVLSLAI